MVHTEVIKQIFKVIYKPRDPRILFTVVYFGKTKGCCICRNKLLIPDFSLH